MKGIEYIKEYKVSLASLAPLKIGNGKDELDLLIDKNDQLPIILGSSITGAIKTYLIDLGFEKMVDSLLGSESQIGVESKIYIDNAYGDKLKVVNRTGIRRDYKFGTTKDKAKYDIDFIDVDTNFELGFKLFAKDKAELDDEVDLIDKAIAGFKSGNLRLGANKTSGFGKFKLNNVEARCYKLSDSKDLAAYILNNKKYEKISVDSFKEIKNNAYVEFTFEGSVIDSMIIKQYQEIGDLKCVNMKNSKDENIIPGTTIKGLFREYSTKILNTLGKDLSIIEDIYGSDPDKAQKEKEDENEEIVRTIGKFLTSDIAIKNCKSCVYNRIKVDRFSGGVVTGGKFDEERVQGDLDFGVSFKKLEKNNQAAMGLIILTLRDLALSKLAIGSSSSIGAGRIQGKKVTILDDGNKVEIGFKDGKLTSNNLEYINNAIKAISAIEGVSR